MRVPARALLAPAAVVAVVGTAFAVGDHGGGTSGPEPSAATSSTLRLVTDEEFCTAFTAVANAQAEQLRAASPEAVATLKATTRELRDLAPGSAMSADARAGVAFVADAFLGLPDDATAQDVVESDDAATITDEANASALAAFVGDACGSSGYSSAK